MKEELVNDYKYSQDNVVIDGKLKINVTFLVKHQYIRPTLGISHQGPLVIRHS